MWRVRQGWGLALVALFLLGLVACASGPSDDSDASGTPNGPSAGEMTATAYVPPTATATVPTTSKTLTCTVRLGEGSEDDQISQTLTCTVRNAPASDTSFALRYGVLDPSGNSHPFTQTCDGSLHDGSGSCTESYQYILPFDAQNGPVTGASSPSGQKLGPIIPTTDARGS
jgi:hypothetical protein